VGERSMLAVFQEVAKSIRNVDIGRLATFDLMYDGISASIRGDMQTAIKMAERQLGEGFPIRILKALFLLKWVREFKATARNVAILLIDRPEIDIRAHEKSVLEALTLLESQSYLQRNGELFEFLTEAEKDIEVEIKHTEIDESQVSDLLSKVLFADVLRDPKIRYEGNLQDYTYARKLDEETIGRDADIAIDIITTEHANHADATTLAMHNVGKADGGAASFRYLRQSRQGIPIGASHRRLSWSIRRRHNSLKRARIRKKSQTLCVSLASVHRNSR
jgi:hypothetical protein